MINLGLEKIIPIKDIFCGQTRKQSRTYSSWTGLEGQVEYRDEKKGIGAPREEEYKAFWKAKIGRQKEGTHLKYIKLNIKLAVYKTGK